jgi:hypothetical protein
MNRSFILIATLMLLAGCGSDDTVAPVVGVDAKPDAQMTMTAKPQGPVTIDYRIIGAPIVGQPLAIDIEIKSLLGPQQITVTYRINDSTAMEFVESQPAQLSIAPMNDEAPSLQQVRLVPLREGRQFLNVAASVDVDGNTLSTAIAIPIQVGSTPRQAEDNGTLTTDESGAAIRSLPATED